MNIAGIDYSLRGPAICIYAGDYETEFSFNKCSCYFLTDIHKYRGVWNRNVYGEGFNEYTEEPQRYETIADWAMDKLTGVDYVSLEGYSFGSQGKRLFQIAENTGLLKYKIYHAGLPLSIIPPTKIKKYASGKGNANKDVMYESFVEDTSVSLRKVMNVTAKNNSPVSDVVDSYFICKLLYTELQMSRLS